MNKLSLAAMVASGLFSAFKSHRTSLLREEQTNTDDSVRALRAHFRPVEVVNLVTELDGIEEVAVYFTKEDWAHVSRAITKIKSASVVIDGESNAS